MQKFLIFVVGIVAGFLAAVICFVMVSHTPVSKLTGGYGRVTSGGAPLVGATVKISDTGGTLSARTGVDGRFEIEVDSRRSFYLSMSNPLMHEVKMTIESGGSTLVSRRFEKRELGENYFDLGTIDVAPR